jgi:hypothetical protein
MGVSYLVADDVGFSMWFFWVARRLMMVLRDAWGLTSHDQYFEHQGIGAYILLGCIYLWAARRQFAAILRKAVLDSPDVDDSKEPASYRLQVLGFLLALVVILAWGRAAGAHVWAVALMIGLWLVSIVVLTRLVSEAGLFAVWLPTTPPQQVVVRALGSATVGARSITALSFMGWKIQDAASCTMANILQGYKMSDLAALRPRANFWLILGALAVALFASHPSAIYAIYSRTVPGLGWWPANAGNSLPWSITTLIRAPQEYTLGNAGNMALGAGIVSALYWLRQRFLWWPFHPLAYAALLGPQFMGDRYGFSILVGWTVRRLVHRFGGHQAYTLFRHAAVGIIVGNALVLLVWTIINYFYPIGQVLIIE